jgi:CheY-like chemotaxis protein
LGHRILVVDDNPDILEAHAAMARLSGHEVAQASSGTEALEALDAFAPDVVLLDIAMPLMNGLDTGRLIRNHPAGKDLLLVAVTGLGNPETRLETIGVGFDLHLVKPVTMEALETVLAQYENETVRR